MCIQRSKIQKFKEEKKEQKRKMKRKGKEKTRLNEEET